MPFSRGRPCFFVVFVCLITTSLCSKNCDVTYDHSLENVQQQGTFVSPDWPNRYPINSHCIYRFVAKPTERVQIKFNFFDIQGVLPQCQFDYVDIYAQIENSSQSLLDTPLLGRFCDDSLENLPRLVISTGHILVISFYSDDRKSDVGFNGTYKFIDASVYNVGLLSKPNSCNFTIKSTLKKTGFIISPTFPGFYPDHLNCHYVLLGQPGERIKIQFIVFSLYHGGDYCPYDYVQMRDGPNIRSPVVGKFCGNYSSVVFFSTYENLYIEFVTGSGRVDPRSSTTIDNSVDFSFDRRGFNISYEFDASFVNIDSMENGDIEHIPGTECDMHIKSKKGSNGTLMSPGYPNPYPLNVVCRYFLDGLSNMQELEKVKVNFRDFDISGTMVSGCSAGHLLVETDRTRSDNERFCGRLYPPNATSKGSRMILTLDTRQAAQRRGFLATYHFITDFDIDGESVVDGMCIFKYDASKYKEGEIKSPRNPGTSEETMNCTYIFRPRKNEKLLINFFTFSLGNIRQNASCINTDNLAIYDGIHNNSPLINRYCGQRFPGPILAEGDTMIILKIYDKPSSSNFEARYEFLQESRFTQRCGQNILSHGGGGILKSPRYPAKYDTYEYCKWQIKANHENNRILLHLYFFHVEGKSTGIGMPGSGLGCQNAVMRIYNGSEYRPKELCGSLIQDTFLSQSSTVELEFLTSGAALGGKGFKISWTEVYRLSADSCYGYLCKTSKYCIDSGLKCNKEPNCGGKDSSDELEGCRDSDSEEPASQTGPAVGGFEILHIAIGASISSFFCIILVICGLYHRRKFRPDRKPPDNDHVEVRYVAAASSCNTTDRLLTIDHNDGHAHTPSHTPTHTPNEVNKSLHSNSPANNTTPNKTANQNTQNKTANQNTQNKTANQNTQNKTANQNTPNKTANQNTPNKTANQNTPNKTANQNTPNQTPSQDTPNQTPNISTVNRTNNSRTTRIQKVSIV